MHSGVDPVEGPPAVPHDSESRIYPNTRLKPISPNSAIGDGLPMELSDMIIISVKVYEEMHPLALCRGAKL